MIRKGRSGVAVLALAVLGAACVETESPTAIEVEPVAAAARGGINMKDPGETIVDVAITAASDPTAPEFTTLVAAVVAADLVDVLNGRRQFTVFAPTDAAFADLGITAANLNDLLATGALTKQLLTDILLYHVAPGSRDSGDVVGSTQIRTMNGGFLGVRVGTPTAGLGVYLEDLDPDNGDSEILAVDIPASNGIIHVIDQVLLPIDL
jgi:uncharacterized surface protein with fasciclin (FAS1) repeats